MGHVQKVNLRGNRLTSASLLKLLKTLSENPGMRDIDILRTSLSPGAVAVAELLKEIIQFKRCVLVAPVFNAATLRSSQKH